MQLLALMLNRDQISVFFMLMLAAIAWDVCLGEQTEKQDGPLFYIIVFVFKSNRITREDCLCV